MILRLFYFPCIAFIGLSQAATTQSIPWNQLGAEAAKQCGGKGLAVTEMWNGYRLECRMQALQAEVTMNDAKIISTSKSKGGGSFSIRASRLGRTTSMQELPVVADWITMKDKVVKTGRSNIIEEYTTMGDGIRQDFVINNKPEGQGKVLLDIAIEGADVTIMNKLGEVEVHLSSGRALLYHDLKVTGADEHELASSFIKSENNVITIAVDDKNASYPVRIDPTISDSNWVGIGGQLPGVDFYGIVNALVFDSSGNLYVGGGFTIAGSTEANSIAKWNGSTWSTLGSGISGTVYALAFDRLGSLYAGGQFDSAGGIVANNIAKWNGNAWSALGSGTNGQIKALAVDNSGNIYAGGWFDTAGGVVANNIAKWNGSVWSTLGLGMEGNIYNDGSVDALAIDKSGNLYVGGQFTTAGGAGAMFIAKWDGNSWSSIDGGMRGYGGFNIGYVLALTIDSSGDLYAGGLFTYAGSVIANNIARWNGSTWSALGSGMGKIPGNSPVNSLAFDSSGNLYAGGQFDSAGGVATNSIAKWNGSFWSTLGSGMRGNKDNLPHINTLAIDGSENLYSGGWFTGAGSVVATNIAKWNGSVWNAFGSGTNGWVSSLAVDRSGHGLYAGGQFTTVGGVVANYIAKWSGSTWSALGSGLGISGSSVNMVNDNTFAFDSSGNLYTGGIFDTAGGVAMNNIAKWNGSSWSALGSGISGTVSALAFDSSGNLYAGGIFDTEGGVATNSIARWNGSAWSALGSGMGGTLPYVNSLASDRSGHGLYAGGRFTTAGGTAANLIAKWNGSTWSALGSGIRGFDANTCINALTFDGSGNLYAGGYFDTAGSIAANNIAKWNGSTWSALGSGTNGSITSLAVDNSGNLYAGGSFTSAGGLTANNIAKWDGNSWSALGSGTNELVNALAFQDSGNLYAGGIFTTAGGKASAYSAMCRLPGTAVIPRKGGNVSQPFLTYDAHAGLMRFQLKSQTQITYRIYSLLGRQVFQASETMGAGEHSMRINTLLNTRPAARGTYIVNFKAGDESIRFRLVVDK
ncbi:MAG: T9SS type A sorting domain-containing protein [Chitinispirillaceae bacterium]